MIKLLVISAVIVFVCGVSLMLAAFEVYHIDDREIVETDWKWLVLGFLLAFGGVAGVTALLIPEVWA